MPAINKEDLKIVIDKLKENKKSSDFEEFYENYRNVVFRIAFSILKNQQDSEEVVQNTFLKIFQLDKDKLPNKNESTWLYSVTKNQALMLMRKKKIEIDIDSIYDIKCEDSDIDKIIDKHYYNKLIHKLSKDEQQIVSLKILGNFSFTEIGKMLNISPNTIKWKYYKSIKTLKLSIGGLLMFVSTFILGKFIEKLEKQENDKIDIGNNKVDNNVSKENNTSVETNSNTIDEYIKSEKQENDAEENKIKDEEAQQTSNEAFTTSIEQESHIENLHTLKLGFLTFSYIFLTFFLIFAYFFIKFQLKQKKKSSK